MEHVGDKLKGTADSVSSTLQPNVRLARLFSLSHLIGLQSEKSTTQQMGDTMSGNSNENQVRHP